MCPGMKTKSQSLGSTANIGYISVSYHQMTGPHSSPTWVSYEIRMVDTRLTSRDIGFSCLFTEVLCDTLALATDSTPYETLNSIPVATGCIDRWIDGCKTCGLELAVLAVHGRPEKNG
jgi:hypothetical protein